MVVPAEVEAAEQVDREAPEALGEVVGAGADSVEAGEPEAAPVSAEARAAVQAVSQGSG